jgi:nicotinamide mononucleotide transporter
MSTPEVIGTAFGILCVYLIIIENILCWPVGIAMVTIYAYVFYDAKLYSDTILQLVYIGLQVYGWYYWLYGDKTVDDRVPITRLTSGEIILWTAAVIAVTAAWGWGMATHTDASLPYWDATTTVLGLTAQYLMARKKLESWLIWIAVDVLSIGIYFTKGLTITAGLYLVFLGMATSGFIAWRRKQIRHSAALVAA